MDCCKKSVFFPPRSTCQWAVRTISQVGNLKERQFKQKKKKASVGIGFQNNLLHCVSVESICWKVRQGRRRGCTASYWNASHRRNCTVSPGAAPSSSTLRTPLQDQAEMQCVVRSYLLPAIKLYLLGLKVLLVQLFSSHFRLPGQFNFKFSQVSHSVNEQLYFLVNRVVVRSHGYMKNIHTVSQYT